VLAIIGKPGGVALLRGVAKKAFVKEWDTLDDSDIDVSFFADIRDGIKANAKAAKLNEDINKKLADDNVEVNSEDADEEDTDEYSAPKKSAPKKSAPKKSAPKKSTLDAEDYE
jgi:hypothetical protein